MPRTARNLPPSAMLHLICRGNNNLRVFRNRNDFVQISNTIRRFVLCSELYIHNYVFMRTHFHLLAWAEDTRAVPMIIKAVTLSYHHYYRRKYTYRGHLWHSRYRSVVIRDEGQWLQCGRYVELNPVHAGICGDPGDYPWSSYHYYAHGKDDPLLQPVMRLAGMAVRKAGVVDSEYQDFIRAGIDLDYQLIKKRYESGVCSVL